jgi:hypothetical protein
MPKQLTYTISKTVRPTNGTPYTTALVSRQYDQANEQYDRRSIKVGTGEETFTPSADLTSLGQTWMRNTSTTPGNYLQVGGATGAYVNRIPPGEAQLVWLEPGITLYLKAATAELTLELEIEDR